MLSHIFSNPAVTTTTGSLALLLLSEAMPFLPGPANGVAHFAVLILKALVGAEKK